MCKHLLKCQAYGRAPLMEQLAAGSLARRLSYLWCLQVFAEKDTGESRYIFEVL